MPHDVLTRSRSWRVRGVAALVGGVAGGLVAALVVAVNPAQASLLAIPVNCNVDKVVLEWDAVAYDLEGTCGVVVIKADDTEVSMPTAQRLVVRGHGNEVDAKPLARVVVRGHDNTVASPSIRSLRLASPGSVVRVEGLLEKAVLHRRHGVVTADQVTAVRVHGNRHRVRARRGYDARVEGDRNRLGYRRLDRLVVAGDGNRARVRRGTTVVRIDGTGNHIGVDRRG